MAQNADASSRRHAPTKSLTLCHVYDVLLAGKGAYNPPPRNTLSSLLPSLLVLSPTSEQVTREVAVGSSPIVRLRNFRPGASVTLTLVSEQGKRQRLAAMSNKAAGYDWMWAVARTHGTAGQKHYIEASGKADELLAYSPSFVIL